MKKHFIISSIFLTLFFSGCTSQGQTQQKENQPTDEGETKAISINEGGYSKSNKYIYFKDTKIENADIITFEVINSGRYNIAKDKNNVFWFNDTINNADPNTINYVGYGFSKDKDNVYNGTKTLTNIDVNTVKFLGLECGDERDVYILDKNNVYKRIHSKEKGIEYVILENADPNTFEYIPWENTISSGTNCRYTKDKNNVYDNGEIVLNANPDNFEPNEIN